ncbi:MAG: protein kinase [Candidatus Udaeobacter sp.]
MRKSQWLTQEEVRRCDLCGAPLSSNVSLPGCLHCLLAGGLNEASERQFQHYQVALRDDGRTLCELGHGAMGITYRAIDVNLGSQVALKVITARFSNQTDARERFRREARVAAQLRHPNVASVFHFGETPSGQCFYAMELVEGETLEARVRREGPLGTQLVIEIAEQVARALLAAERHGLVHRDLKPSNLMLVPNDQENGHAPGVKVIDFGLAEAFTGEDDGQDSKRTGFTGTPGYASPEQYGAVAQKLDSRSDIYSLAASLWYALTGRAPFVGRNSEELRDSQMNRPPPVTLLRKAKVPEPLIALVISMLAANPDGRPQSARELLLAIEKCRRKLAAFKRRPRSLVAILFCILLVTAAFGLTKYFSRSPVAAPDAPPPEKSIAVLPFENLSDDKQNASFTSGVQDEILSDLARIADLKVISRTSVMQYRSGTTRNLREIGKALGVANIVEGSVQRAGSRIRVVAQLIDARRDIHLWGETYDRDLSDVFAIQDQIAQQIAAQLQARISPQERAIIQEKPTSDLTAYAFYNQARNERNHEKRVKLLQEAIRRDPDFILAYCLLAKTETFIYAEQNFGSEAIRETTAAQADQVTLTALRLRPDRGETHLARANFCFVTFRFSEARKELDIALRLLPNDAEATLLDARLDRHENRWDDALIKARRAAALDPHNEYIVVWTSESYRVVRRYQDGEEFLRQAIAKNPGSTKLFNGSLASFKIAEGDLASARSLSAAPDVDTALEAQFASAYYARDYGAALQIIAAAPPELVETDFVLRSPQSCAEATVYRAQGDLTKAKQAFRALRQAMDATRNPNARNEWFYYITAGFDAALGRNEDAIREARRAVDLHPVAQDPVNGPPMVLGLALVYAWTGERDRAIEQLEIAAKIPSNLSYGDLRFNPDWDTLRGNPRFEKIVAALDPHLTR